MSDKPCVAILESIKPCDNRIPIHPKHFSSLEKTNVFVQSGYAGLFHETDETLQQAGFHLLPREVLLRQADILFILKPLPEDLRQAKIGSTIIGWCHAVQQQGIAQIAVQRRLTLMAMEDMYMPHPQLGRGMRHLFYENNFMAGYAGVTQALEATPVVYASGARVAIITYGTVSQGAVSRLLELGFRDITVFSRRHEDIISNKKDSVKYRRILPNKGRFLTASGEQFSQVLIEFDIIVNGIMQNVLSPYLFLTKDELMSSQNKLIIDISCDDQMGFDFARSTTIDNPIINVADHYYYAVENTPALYWRNISTCISKQLCYLLNAFVLGECSKSMIDCIHNATVISEGRVMDENIIEYQACSVSHEA
jgi:N5-(carboxyethyl)ornithine synthase